MSRLLSIVLAALRGYRLIGKPPASKAGTGGSNPSIPAVIEQYLEILRGWVPERPNGRGCKPRGIAFGGSNPSPPTDLSEAKRCGGEGETPDRKAKEVRASQIRD